MARITRAGVVGGASNTRPARVPSVSGQLAIGQVAKQAGKQLVSAGASFAEAANKSFQDALFSRSFTGAIEEFNTGYQQRLASTTDEDGNPTFGSLPGDISKLGNDVLQKNSLSILDLDTRQRFRQRFQEFTAGKSIAAQSAARKQQVQFSSAQLSSSIQSITQQALQDDPAFAQGFLSDANEMISDALANGTITPGDANRMRESTRGAINVGMFERLITENPESARGVLNGMEASELGLTVAEKSKLFRYSESVIRSEERENRIAERKDKELFKEQQNKNADNLENALIRGTASSSDIDLAQDSGAITVKHANRLLKSADSRADKLHGDVKTNTAINAQIESGNAITAKQIDIDKHYNQSVALRSVDGEGNPVEVTTEQKAEIAVSYVSPVRPLQKEISIKFASSNTQDNADALRAYQFLAIKQPLVLSGMSKKDQAIAALATTLTFGTGMSDADAVEKARDTVTNRTDEDRKLSNAEFNKTKAFKLKGGRLSDTVEEMFDVSGLRGIRGIGVDPKALGTLRVLLRQAYQETGSREGAVQMVKTQVSATMGVTEFNETKGFLDDKEVAMFFPPEKMYPGISPDSLKQDLADFSQQFLPEGVEGEDVLIESDELTKLNPQQPSWGIYYLNEAGQEIPITDEEGNVKRWFFDAELTKEAEDDAGLAELEKNQEDFFNIEDTDPGKVSNRPSGGNISKDAEAFREEQAAVGKITIPTRGASKEILLAITDASEVVGVDADYMAAIASVESNFRAVASPKTSDAQGLFQFVIDTWRPMVKKYGEKYDIGINDRNDPRKNAIMAALLMRDDARTLRSILGREPNLRETYLAHFSGIGRARQVLKMLKKNPKAHVSSVYNDKEIKANSTILKGSLRGSVDRLTDRVIKASGGKE